MEDKLRDHITSNLGKLVRNTWCTDPLIIYLMENGILGQDDQETLDANRMPSEKSFELYQILQRRCEPAYIVLVVALRQTRQFASASILEFFLTPTEKEAVDARLEALICNSIANELRLPDQGPVIVGREDEVNSIHVQFSSPKSKGGVSLVLYGLGGIGKTELALSYLRKFRLEYDHCLWIPADSKDSIKSKFLEIAFRHCGASQSSLENSDDINQLMKDVYTNFARKKTLFVFDNADSKNDILPHLPRNFVTPEERPCVLITSKLCQWSAEFRVQEVLGLKDYESLELVREKLQEAEAWTISSCQVELLIEKFSNKDRNGQRRCFPLTLQQALAYISHKRANVRDDYRIEDYLDEFERHHGDHLLKRTVSPEDHLYRKPTTSVWLTALDAISEDPEYGARALHIFKMMSFLHPDKIPEDFFIQHCTPESDRELVENAINLLCSFCMISSKRDSHERFLTVHRLVQKVTRFRLDDTGEHKKICQLTFSLLENKVHSQEELKHFASAWKFASRHPSVLEELYWTSCGRMSTPLHLLSSQHFGDNLKELKILLKNLETTNLSKKMKIILSVKDSLGRTPLCVAVATGNVRGLEVLIDAGVPVDSLTTNMGSWANKPNAAYLRTKFTPLHEAALFGDIECAKLLIETDPSLASKLTGKGETPAVIAANRGHLNVLQALEPGNKALMLHCLIARAYKQGPEAVEVCKTFVLQELTEEEREVLIRQQPNLLTSTIIPCPEELKTFFIHLGAICRGEAYISKAIEGAAGWNKLAEVKRLVQEGAHPTRHVSQSGWSALHVASQHNFLHIVTFIVENTGLDDVDIDVENKKGDRPLHTAAFHGCLEVVEYLLRRGAKLNTPNRFGFTPVFGAAVSGEFRVVLFLLQHFGGDLALEMGRIDGNSETFGGKLNLSLLHLTIAFDEVLVFKILKDRYQLQVDSLCLLVAVLFNSIQVLKECLENRRVNRGTFPHQKVNLATFIATVCECVSNKSIASTRRGKFVMKILYKLCYPIHWSINLTPANLCAVDGLCNAETKGMVMLSKRACSSGWVSELQNSITRFCLSHNTVRKYVEDVRRYVSQKRKGEQMLVGEATSVIHSVYFERIPQTPDSNSNTMLSHFGVELMFQKIHIFLILMGVMVVMIYMHL